MLTTSLLLNIVQNKWLLLLAIGGRDCPILGLEELLGPNDGAYALRQCWNRDEDDSGTGCCSSHFVGHVSVL